MSKIITLNELEINKEAKVISIDSKSILKRRFEDLGIVRGTKIKYIFSSIFNNPKAYLIKGSTIAIRENDSKYIKVIIDD